MPKIKLLFILIILLFIPFFTQAKSCNPGSYACGDPEDWSCINNQCQQARCGDGVCNACATSPCTHSETLSCPQDCKNTNTTPTSQYKDSDNGKNYHTQGTTTGKENNSTQTRTDSCLNNQLLTEYYLDNANNLKQQTVVCNHGCSNGVCKEKDCRGDNVVTNGKKINYQVLPMDRGAGQYGWKWVNIPDGKQIQFYVTTVPADINPVSNIQVWTSGYKASGSGDSLVIDVIVSDTDFGTEENFLSAINHFNAFPNDSHCTATRCGSQILSGEPYEGALYWRDTSGISGDTLLSIIPRYWSVGKKLYIAVIPRKLTHFGIDVTYF